MDLCKLCFYTVHSFNVARHAGMVNSILCNKAIEITYITRSDGSVNGTCRGKIFLCGIIGCVGGSCLCICIARNTVNDRCCKSKKCFFHTFMFWLKKKLV